MNSEKPIGIALVICDQIIEDKSTGKRSLFGLFQTVLCTDFPALLEKLCVFVSLTQLNGKVPLILRCRNESFGEPLIAVPGEAVSTNPNDVLELGFEFDRFSFPRPGLYTFELLWHEELILQSRFNVLSANNT